MRRRPTPGMLAGTVCEHPGVARHRLAPRYASGDDFAIQVAGVCFRFSAADFASRVGAAAARLRFVPCESLGAGELEDLVALTAYGAIAAPASDLAGHVVEHTDELLGFPEDLVHWLRRLVFRGAWLDQQIAEGVVEPVFDGRHGFGYRCVATGMPVADGPSPADWSASAYRAST